MANQSCAANLIYASNFQKSKINKVGIVGSGTMGSQIAALFANYGVSVLLLDVETEKDGVYTNEIAEKAIKRLKKFKPSPKTMASAVHATWQATFILPSGTFTSSESLALRF